MDRSLESGETLSCVRRPQQGPLHNNLPYSIYHIGWGTMHSVLLKKGSWSKSVLFCYCACIHETQYLEKIFTLPEYTLQKFCIVLQHHNLHNEWGRRDQSYHHKNIEITQAALGR